MPDGLDISTAMKLLHSSNAKKIDVDQKDPLAKEILSSLRELKKLNIEFDKAIKLQDDSKMKVIEESINSLTKKLSDQGVSQRFFYDDGVEKMEKFLSDELITEIKNDIGDMTDSTVAALVKMMQTGESVEDNSKLTKDMEDSLILAMSATLNKAGLVNNKDIKDVINYIKSMRTDMLVTNDTISEIVSMNKSVNNQLIKIIDSGENNTHMISDMLTSMDDKELQMLMRMEELPLNISQAVKIEEKRRDFTKKLKGNPVGEKLIEINESLLKFNKKWNKFQSAISDPLGFVKPMFKAVGSILNLIWKTIIPTIVSMAISLFTVVLPWVILILGVVILALLAIYVIWKFFGNFIKKVLWGVVTTIWEIVKSVAKAVWDFLPVVWEAIKVVWNIVSGAFEMIDALFSGDWAGLGNIVSKIASSVWDLLLKFGEFLINHPLLGTIISILSGIAAWNTAKTVWDTAAWAAKYAWDTGKWLVLQSGNIFSSIGKAVSFLGPVLAAIPVIGWIILAIGTVVAFVWFFRKEIWAFIKQVLSWVWDGLQIAFNWTVDIIGKIWDWAVGIWDTLSTPIKFLITSLLGIMLAPIIIPLGIMLAPFLIIFAIVKYWDPIMECLNNFLGWVIGVFKAGWNIYTGIIQSIYDWVIGVFKAGWNIYTGIIQSIYDWVIGVFKAGWEGVTFIISGIWGSVKKAWELLTDLPSALLGGVKDVVGGIGKALNPFNWFADGGVVTGPTKAVIGEAGPEAVLPLQGSGKNTLMAVLNDFFDTFLPFFKPLVNFLWDNFKPYMPILQAVLDSIYSVVYSIISGLATLPGWLGGNMFAQMLSRLAPPVSGGGISGGATGKENKQLLLSIISGDIGNKPVLSVVGVNRAEIASIDSSKKPMLPSTFKDISGYVAESAKNMEVPKYAQNIQKGIESIGDGIDNMSSRLEKMEKNIIGAVSSSNKSTTPDKQFELSKLLSNKNFNGSKI